MAVLSAAVAKSTLRLRFRETTNDQQVHYTYQLTQAKANETAGHAGQQVEWPNCSTIQGSPVVLDGVSWREFGLVFDSSAYHNGDWSLTVHYHWEAYTSEAIPQTAEGDDSIVFGFQVKNMWLVTAFSFLPDESGGVVESPSFLVSQGPDDTPSVVVQPTAELLLGGVYDRVTYVVKLYDIARKNDASPCLVSAESPEYSLAASDPVVLTLDKVPRGAYAFDVEANRKYAHDSTHWCEGLPTLTPKDTTVTSLSLNGLTATASTDVGYQIGTKDGTAANFEFFGATDLSPDIELHCAEPAPSAVIGYHTKNGLQLSIAAAGKHYLGLEVRDDDTTAYRCHLPRWCLARGWTCEVPVVTCVKFVKPREFPGEFSLSRHGAFYQAVGTVGDPEAPNYWLYRGRWSDDGVLFSAPHFSFVPGAGKARELENMQHSDIWLYDGHGGIGENAGQTVGFVSVEYGANSWDHLLSSLDVAQHPGHIKLALVLACQGAPFTQALVAANGSSTCFAVSSGYFDLGWKQSNAYLQAFTRVLSATYGQGTPVELYQIHNTAMKMIPLQRARIELDTTRDAFLIYGNPHVMLDPVPSSPVFSGGSSV